ncbi:uncharacterized protein [Euphorbia lathyris]|uniref:uncharacterized protein n=1 Tax=Euphorbia lathyris TaxID=212925 RepID=UPI003314256E
MAKSRSYLTNNVEDLTVHEEEGFGDSEIDKNENNDILFSSSGAESQCPPNSVVRKVSRSTSSKRTSEEIITSSEFKRRQTSFDTIIELLCGSGIGSSSGSSKIQRVSDVLSTMGVSEKRGDKYFVSAIKYLSEEKHADCFLALRNDNQRWIYLKYLDSGS